MSQALEKLETNFYELVQKFNILAETNKHLTQENNYLKERQAITEKQHQAAIDELGDTLVSQMNKLKSELQEKIDHLNMENQTYRTLLNDSAAEIRILLSRLPQEVPTYDNLYEEQA